MPKTLADVEVKKTQATNTSTAEEVKKGRPWLRWVITPIVLLTVASTAFLMIRRRLNATEE